MSNGSEHTPERCVHAVDGPDWAGLREPTSWKERAIAAEAEVEKLRISNENLRRISNANGDWNVRYGEVCYERDALQANRDEWRSIAHFERAEAAALQARLDAMTVEWAVHWIPGDTYHDAPTEADAVSLAGEFVRSKARAVQRLVGPWTVVPEGDGNV